MKKTLAAFTLAMLSSHAAAYDAMSGIERDWQRHRDMAEMQRIDQAARYRQTELNDRMQQLERRERIERSDNEWRVRQLEAEQYRLGR